MKKTAKNLSVLMADCFSEKPMFKYIFQEDTAEQRYQKMLWTMERKARLLVSRLESNLIDDGVTGSCFWFKPGQSPGFHPILLIKEGLAFVPIKFGLKVFKRINEVSLHEIEVYKKHRKQNMWVIDTLAVTPKKQRQGLGRVLLEDKLKSIKARGEGVFVLTHNAENIPYYKALGFKLVDEMPVGKSDVIGYCFTY